jgi:hypothetical protein
MLISFDDAFKQGGFGLILLGNRSAKIEGCDQAWTNIGTRNLSDRSQINGFGIHFFFQQIHKALSFVVAKGMSNDNRRVGRISDGTFHIFRADIESVVHDLGADCPCTVYALRNHKGQTLVDYDFTIKTSEEDLKKCGFPATARPIEWETYYCPHVSCQDYANGWYDKVDKLQGKKNTYFAGEVLGFGDMEETCEVSKDLIGRFF